MTLSEGVFEEEPPTKLYREIVCTTAEDLMPYQGHDDVFVIFNDVICTYSEYSDEWSHDDGPAGGRIHFPLWEGDTLIALVPTSAQRETRVGVTQAEKNLWYLLLEDRANGGTMSTDGIRMAERYKTSWEPVG